MDRAKQVESERTELWRCYESDLRTAKDSLAKIMALASVRGRRGSRDRAS